MTTSIAPYKIDTKAGIVTLRTVPMPLHRANNFAKMLNANRAYSQATVHPTSAGSEKFRVLYLPASIERQEAIVNTYQQEQIKKAIAEIDGWVWSGNSATVKNVTTLSGNTYRVTADSCNCPHFQYRVKSTGCLCKHIAGFHMMGFGEIAAEPAPKDASVYDWAGLIDADLIPAAPAPAACDRCKKPIGSEHDEFIDDDLGTCRCTPDQLRIHKLKALDFPS